MSLSLLFTGDFCPNFNDLDEESFSDIKDTIINNNLLICNLECSIANGKEKTIIKEGPSLSCKKEQLDFLANFCPTLFTLANNHTLDFGCDGLYNIFNYCREKGYKHVGAGKNLEEAQKPYLYISEEGYKITIINCCEQEFSIAGKTTAGANPINPIYLYNRIKEAQKKSDFIIVVSHGCHEYYQLPSPRIQDTYRFFIDCGANVVIGHHPHCISGMEEYNNGIIYYSLGNFYFNNKSNSKSIWNNGILVRLVIDEKNNTIVTHTAIPFIQCYKNNKVELLKGNELNDFLIEFNYLNSIINDREILEEHYNTYLISQEKKAISRILPYSNRYLLALYKRGFIPSLMNKKNYATRLNAIQCESHRDILQHVLNKKINE